MIYLHKIIPVFLLPVGLTVLLVLTGLMLRRRVLCWIGLAVLWLSGTPVVANFAMRAAEGWQVREQITALPEADAIVVLSGFLTLAPGNPPVSEWDDADRFFAGVELHKAGKAPLLVFTGGWSPWRPHALPEGQVLIPYAMDMGVPRASLMTTGKVVNTAEEANAVADLFGGEKKRILLVTSAFHMRRARLLFERAGFEVAPFPVDFQVAAERKVGLFNFLPGAKSLTRTETALRELYGMLFYRLSAVRRK
ncbi:MAG: YdcF family protein [Candidatus Loosdrechtia sp.]|uniref:YdcF family protein n=1 Tax=Candidatus Loosdrechtia sp. TaxID=3101272 RepID=UPI003A664897|nr:MAG: YdcF family protein [Candidatus Jettenia sp. AMX2]